MKRRTLLSFGCAALSAAVVPSLQAQERTKILLGYTAVSDFAVAFVAAERGYFAKRGLDIEFRLIPLNATLPAALQSDSLQIGGMVPTVFLSAVDGGLQQVAIAGGTIGTRSSTELALVARSGSGIRSAQDVVGKKVGVPGIGSALHVTFRAWLSHNGVDWRKVNFIETAFPQHADMLRAGTVDAVVSADPFMSRIVDSGVGYIASYYTTFLPDRQQKLLYVATSEWVAQHPGVPKAFRDALAEAAAFMKKPENDAEVRAIIGKYIKLPPPVLAKIALAAPEPVLTSKDLEFWVGLMNDQGMLKSKIDVKRLLAV